MTVNKLNAGKMLASVSCLILLMFSFSVVSMVHAGQEPLRITCLEKVPTIDGVISEEEWPTEHVVRLSRAFHDKLGIYLYFAHDNDFLYLGAYVEDQALWADGGGSGEGEYWEHYDDDSIEWYFDPDNSGGTFLTGSDRFLALNIGNISDPKNGSGIVSRRSFNQGDGAGGASGVTAPGVMPSGLSYAVQYYGTVNDQSDTDTGYSMEVAVPWTSISRSAPSDGDWMKINAIVISDDTGRTRDWSDNRDIEPASLRFTTPVRLDEYVELKCSQEHSSQSGLTGPDSYIVLQFHSANDTTAPGSVGTITTTELRPYSVKLNWTSAGDNGNAGDCAGFDIRYSKNVINESNFSQAAKWPLNLSHHSWSGQSMSARIMGLEPGTTYYFAIKSFDEAQNYSNASTAGPITTPSISAFSTSISETSYKGGVFPAPGGRYFIREDGANFIPVGHHFLLQDGAVRHLYPGLVWTGSTLWDYSSETNALETVTSYLDNLKANGINTMRIFLEDFSLDVSGNGNFNGSNGAYWIEFPQGTYNEDMRDFLVDLLKLCAERNIYLLINPFDTFYYDDYLSRTAWSSSNGGPLTDINSFFHDDSVLDMAKARWEWVISVILSSGYADAVMGYELLNEWDSFEWTLSDPDANTDAKTRVAFIEELAAYIRTLDSTRMIVSSTTSLDPRGALADFGYYSSLIDASLPHLYFPGNREPWNNPAIHIDTAVFKEQSRAISWFTTNQLHNKPVLNGEWGPSDGWMPDPSNPSYFSSFQEEDDELITTCLWFSELAGGAAGPGIRMQGGVRAFSSRLHLSDNMHGTQKTISAFVENSSTSPIFDFSDFNSRHMSKDLEISGTTANINATGCTDGKKGLVYLKNDKNSTVESIISGASFTVSGIDADYDTLKAEFWKTSPDQTVPAHIRTASVSNKSFTFSIPDFSDDWAVRFYPYGTGISTNLSVGSSSMIQSGDTVTFSANAVDSDNRNMYYRFDLIPGYGTGSYDPNSNFEIIQNFSQSKTASRQFSETGSYILVTWASPTNGFSSGYTQIMGGSITVSDSISSSPCIRISSLDFSTGQSVQQGELVTITAEAVNNCSATTYYRFDLIPGYGTDSYDPNNNYQIIQDFSVSSSCAYRFSEAGSYIVVVWASDNLGILSGAPPIFGGSIMVSEVETQ